MLKSLLSDPIARVTIGIWTLVTATVFIPVLPAHWVQFYSEYVLDLPFLVLIPLAVWYGHRTIED